MRRTGWEEEEDKGRRRSEGDVRRKKGKIVGGWEEERGLSVRGRRREKWRREGGGVDSPSHTQSRSIYVSMHQPWFPPPALDWHIYICLSDYSTFTQKYHSNIIVIYKMLRASYHPWTQDWWATSVSIWFILGYSNIIVIYILLNPGLMCTLLASPSTQPLLANLNYSSTTRTTLPQLRLFSVDHTNRSHPLLGNGGPLSHVTLSSSWLRLYTPLDSSFTNNINNNYNNSRTLKEQWVTCNDYWQTITHSPRKTLYKTIVCSLSYLHYFISKNQPVIPRLYTTLHLEHHIFQLVSFVAIHQQHVQ